LTQFGGAINVLGRPLGAGEIYRLSTVLNIVNWYREREASDNWAAWERLNPERAKFLDDIYKLAVKEYGDAKKWTTKSK
jgi:hypothetical protein